MKKKREQLDGKADKLKTLYRLTMYCRRFL